MFCLIVRFDLKDEQACVDFDALVDDLLPAVNGEPGTIEYSVHRVLDSPESRVFIEKYESRAAFDAHEESDHTKAFLQARGSLIDVLRVEVLGDGDEFAR